MEIDSWISMPKVELHAHLNGSVRNSTLLELAKELGEKGMIVFSDVEHVILKNGRSLTEVFKLFDLIHIFTTDHSTLTRITKEVVEDFAAENVVYLELRTTPKRNESKGMTKHSYIEAVVEGLRRVHAVDVDFVPFGRGEKKPNPICTDSASNGLAKKKIYVRLLLSIDRRETLEAAMETVRLALEMRAVGVVGIDLSGNPKVGNWETFLPALKFAREHGLRVTLHCGEVPNQEEIHAMLDFRPERVGHACCFGEEAWIKLNSTKIPVEICLTSNIQTNTISSIDVHHFGLDSFYLNICLNSERLFQTAAFSFVRSFRQQHSDSSSDILVCLSATLYKKKHPLILCTDDSGVFSTSLSREYAIAAAAFGLGKEELFQLARNAVDFIFAEEDVVRELRAYFSQAAKELSFQ